MQELQTLLQHNFSNSDLLTQALTHKSYKNENSETNEDNEKLEFLGDAVLDLALSQYLMNQFPTDDEGALSKKRASLVNEESLSQLASEMGLASYLRLGKGELRTGGLTKPRLLASSFEAIIGALFLDGGYVKVAEIVERLFKNKISEIAHTPDFAADFKTRLQERAQELYRTTPKYQVDAETGPDHDKKFEISVWVNEAQIASGEGRSKKAAEQEAARVALEIIETSKAQTTESVPI